MKSHPTPEQWTAFLYGEDAPAEHLLLDNHLRACASCRQHVQRWRETRRSLDAWLLPEPQPRANTGRRLRWVAAAAVLVGAGLLLGRLSSAPPDAQQLQTALHGYVDRQVEKSRHEWAQLLEQRESEMAQTLRAAAAAAASVEAKQSLAQYAHALEEQLETDRQTILAAFRQLDERRETDISELREDLQTVAVNADDGLTRAQEELLHLASASKTETP